MIKIQSKKDLCSFDQIKLTDRQTKQTKNTSNESSRIAFDQPGQIYLA